MLEATFCGGLQSSQWYQHLVTKKPDGDEMAESKVDDIKVRRTFATEFFSVEPLPLLYSHELGIYKQPPSAHKPNHTNVATQPIHFWRSCGDWEAVRDKLNYKSHGDMPTTHL